MIDLKTGPATKLGALVTCIVLLGACSHKVIKQEAQEAMQPIEESAAPLPTPEPEISQTEYTPPVAKPVKKSAANLNHKHKRKTRVATHRAKKSKHLNRIAKREKVTAAQGQIRDYTPPAPPAPPAVTPPPPVFNEPQVQVEAPAGFWRGIFTNWAFWLVLLSATGLGAIAYRTRFQKGPRRKLVYNA